MECSVAVGCCVTNSSTQTAQLMFLPCAAGCRLRHSSRDSATVGRVGPSARSSASTECVPLRSERVAYRKKNLHTLCVNNRGWRIHSSLACREE